jgi:ATP-dependent DNA helicase RecG
MDDMELLKSAQLYQTDPETGKSGVTLAGLLLLGKRSPLLSAVPHHRTDLILRKVNLDRYDDRDFVDVNLVKSYDRIMAFVAKHLPDPFYLEGTTNISIRDAIFREVASNILIHREYTNAFPAKLIIERGQVRTENSNRPHGFGALNPETFTPFPKNPVIAAFFRQIGRADELGSGMRKMMRYGKAYGGADPEMIEGDVFKIVARVPEFGPAGEAETGAQEAQSRAQSGAQSDEIVELLGAGALSAAELVNQLGLKSKTGALKRSLQQLIDGGLAEYTIPDKPTSRLQKYRLTEKGRKVLKGTERGIE